MFGLGPAEIKAVEDWAKSSKLTVLAADAGKRRVQVEGPVAADQQGLRRPNSTTIAILMVKSFAGGKLMSALSSGAVAASASASRKTAAPQHV